MPPRAQSAISLLPSHSLQSLRSLYLFVCISTFPVGSCFSLLSFFYGYSLLPSIALLPSVHHHPPNHSYPCTYGNTDHSIGSTVNKSKGLAGTCHHQHPPACFQSTVLSSFCSTQSCCHEKTLQRAFKYSCLVWKFHLVRMIAKQKNKKNKPKH